MNKEQLAREELQSFMLDMKGWEINTYNVLRTALEEGRPQEEIQKLEGNALQKLKDTFDAHRLKGAKNTSRLKALSYSDPPTYDPETETIEEVQQLDDMVVVTTRKTVGLKGTFRYTLKVADVATLSKREMLRYTGRWEPVNF